MVELDICIAASCILATKPLTTKVIGRVRELSSVSRCKSQIATSPAMSPKSIFRQRLQKPSGWSLLQTHSTEEDSTLHEGKSGRHGRSHARLLELRSSVTGTGHLATINWDHLVRWPSKRCCSSVILGREHTCAKSQRRSRLDHHATLGIIHEPHMDDKDAYEKPPPTPAKPSKAQIESRRAIKQECETRVSEKEDKATSCPYRGGPCFPRNPDHCVSRMIDVLIEEITMPSPVAESPLNPNRGCRTA